MLRSVAVFADILGFKQDMIRAMGVDGGVALLGRLRAALAQAYGHLQADVVEEGSERLWDFKAFTDNVVLGYPILSDNLDGESELGHSLFALIQFQCTMVMHGFFVRAGVAVGDLFMDRDIVYGAGLLHAYQLESEGHGPPRILLGHLGDSPSDSTLLRLVLYHLAHYDDVTSAPHNDELLIDLSDGGVFVDYLSQFFSAELDDDTRGPIPEVIGTHRATVAAQLKAFAGNDAVRKKYEWVGAYHDFRCAEAGIVEPDLRISPTDPPADAPRFARLSQLYPSREELVREHPWVDRGRR